MWQLAFSFVVAAFFCPRRKEVLYEQVIKVKQYEERCASTRPRLPFYRILDSSKIYIPNYQELTNRCGAILSNVHIGKKDKKPEMDNPISGFPFLQEGEKQYKVLFMSICLSA